MGVLRLSSCSASQPAPLTSVGTLRVPGLPVCYYSVSCSVSSVVRRASLNTGFCSGICCSFINMFLLF